MDFKVERRPFLPPVLAFNCPYCRDILRSPIDEAGTKQVCPSCRMDFVTPGKDALDEYRKEQAAAQAAKAQRAAERKRPKPSAPTAEVIRVEAVRRPSDEIIATGPASVPVQAFPRQSAVPIAMSSGREQSRSPREYRRTCQRCGTIWHSLLSREKKLKKSVCCNQCDVTTCNRTQQLIAKSNLQASEAEYERLHKCPNCGSSAYEEQII